MDIVICLCADSDKSVVVLLNPCSEKGKSPVDFALQPNRLSAENRRVAEQAVSSLSKTATRPVNGYTNGIRLRYRFSESGE